LVTCHRTKNRNKGWLSLSGRIGASQYATQMRYCLRKELVDVLSGSGKNEERHRVECIGRYKNKGERSHRALTHHSDWGKVGQPMQRVGELLDFGARNSDGLLGFGIGTSIQSTSQLASLSGFGFILLLCPSDLLFLWRLGICFSNGCRCLYLFIAFKIRSKHLKFA